MWLLTMWEIELVGVCTVPLALAAEPLGNISLQQPLQQIFKLCSEGVWKLHVLQGLKRGQTKGGGQRKGCLRTWRPWHLHWNVFKQVSHHILPFTSNTTSPNNPWQLFQKESKVMNIKVFFFYVFCVCLRLCSPNRNPPLSWDLRYYIIVYNTSVSICNPILIPLHLGQTIHFNTQYTSRCFLHLHHILAQSKSNIHLSVSLIM